jgi:hypothetical protein
MELMVTEAASNAVRHTDVRPEGTPWLHTTEVDHVPGFVRYRLAAWRSTSGDERKPFVSSPNPRAAAEQSRLRAFGRARSDAAANAR